MSEYLIEVEPGRELLYRTPLALRASIRSGEITANSRVFHRATSSWVSITEHPEYRKIQAERHPPPWRDPPMPPRPEALPAAPKHRRFFRGLAEIRGLAETGMALATSGWASLRKRFDSHRTEPARSPAPARPPTSAKPPTTARGSKPAPSAQPGQSTQPTGTQTPEPTRSRWTFYP